MELRYGDSAIDLKLPPHIDWHVLEKKVISSSAEMDVIQQGIDALLQQLADRLKKKSRITLICPDHTRKCNLPLILPALVDGLEKNFLADIEILIANGCHALQPETAVAELVSPAIYHRIPTFQHDALDDEQMLHFGQTSYGTDVRLNAKVKADFIITVGGILYHYFAGFGGGPKMILPGVAAYETIRQNHRRAIAADGHLHPRARHGNILANPVYNDLAEGADFVPNTLSLQVVLSPAGGVVFCAAGPIIATQKKLIPRVQELYSVEIAGRADVVIASAGGFPGDVNLIQAHKSIHHAFQAVRRGGVIILFAECREGIGSTTFLPYCECGSATAIGKALLEEFRMHGQTALALKEKAESVTIYFISALDDDIVIKAGMRPCRSTDDALADIKSREINKGYIMPRANMTVPVLKRS
ncbi:nickel-dependent lactate racemase [candidate division KSB1 bacterium]|nr:nickel-dependent lactate racemase [candidate division KSB1 bacterium]